MYDAPATVKHLTNNISRKSVYDVKNVISMLKRTLSCIQEVAQL